MLYTNLFFCICSNRGAQLDFNGNCTKCSWIHRIIHFHHKKGGADKFKALQHIRVKSYKLRANLVDFGGTAQKEQLVYLARGAMSMAEPMANPVHSTIVGIWYFGMVLPCQFLLIDVTKKTCVWYFRMGCPLLSAASIDFSLFFSCEVNIGYMWTAEMHNHRLFWMFSMNCQACVFDCNVQKR